MFIFAVSGIYPAIRDASTTMSALSLPSPPGIYALLIQLHQPARIQVGRLGAFGFPAGWYVYVGSARGTGGLAARVSRHLRAEKRLHWHIDYLLLRARVVDVQLSVGRRGRECAIAQRVARHAAARIIAPRFGASDCDCAAHLFYFRRRPDLAQWLAGCNRQQ